MYSRISRTFSIVGRQLTKKLCETTKNNVPGVIVCSSTINSCSALRNVFLKRNYCDKSSKETEIQVPELLSPDEEAEKQLQEFLSVPENERIYKIIELEVEVLRQNSEKVPDFLKPRHWYELLQLDSRSKRKRYLAFLFGLEKKKQHQKNVKLEKQKEREERGPTDNIYRLGNNTMFLRIYDTTMNHMWNGRLVSSILHGQPVVLDCSYDNYMNRREMKNCARQLKLCFAENRIHHDPFNMYLCNVDTSSELTKALHRFIPPLFDEDFPVNVRTESYLDIFDKNKLIYLSPHSQEEMNEYDHDAVYIIGAFVDKSTNEPVSMAKAKKLGLKTLKLPLDRYLQWGSSSGKNLTINAVMKILLDMRQTGSWTEALKNVPRRKLVEFRQATENRRLQRMMEIGNSDGDSDTDEMNLNESVALQMLNKRTPQRYNNNPRRYNNYSGENTGRNFRSSHKHNSESYNESFDDNDDFSMEARAKLKKNWKN